MYYQYLIEKKLVDLVNILCVVFQLANPVFNNCFKNHGKT